MSRIAPKPGPIAKPGKKRRKYPHRSEPHLKCIRQLPCVLTSRPAEPAHVSYGDPDRGKPGPSLGKRAADKWTVPLCPELHRLLDKCQHDENERDWWEQFGVDPLQLAEELWACTGDIMSMELRVLAHRPMHRAARHRITTLLKGN